MIAFMTPRSLETAIDVKCAVSTLNDLPTLNSTFLLIKMAYADITQQPQSGDSTTSIQISIVSYSTVKAGEENQNTQLNILRPHHPIYYYKVIPSTNSPLLGLTKNPPIKTHLTINTRKKVTSLILYEH